MLKKQVDDMEGEACIQTRHTAPPLPRNYVEYVPLRLPFAGLVQPILPHDTVASRQSLTGQSGAVLARPLELLQLNWRPFLPAPKAGRHGIQPLPLTKLREVVFTGDRSLGLHDFLTFLLPFPIIGAL